jgi:hypothetical protein
MTKNIHAHALTLRIERSLDDDVTTASYDAGLSKTDWIRRAIHQSLSYTRSREIKKNMAARR